MTLPPEPVRVDPDAAELVRLTDELRKADPKTRGRLLDEAGLKMCHFVLKSPENFQACFDMLVPMDLDDRKQLLGWLLVEGISSVGGSTDFIAKKQGLEKLGLLDAREFHLELLKATGGRSPNPAQVVTMAKELQLSHEDLAIIIASAGARRRGVVEAFMLLDQLPNDQTRADVFRKAGPSLLGRDPRTAMTLVEKAKPKELRSEYLMVVVPWLQKRGDTETAKIWDAKRH